MSENLNQEILDFIVSGAGDADSYYITKPEKILYKDTYRIITIPSILKVAKMESFEDFIKKRKTI